MAAFGDARSPRPDPPSSASSALSPPYSLTAGHPPVLPPLAALLSDGLPPVLPCTIARGC
eukprot:5820490-Prymnesium_polylepis.1